MESLQNISNIFEILQDKHLEDRDKEVAAWEEQERIRELKQKIHNAQIPLRYETADIEKIHPKIREWSQHPTVGLLLQGDMGRGKTYAAIAIIIHMLETKKIWGAKFYTLNSLFNAIKAEWNEHNTNNTALSICIGTPLLVIDDFGKERLTEWSLPIFFQIIDERLNNNKPTIITTNYNISDVMDKMTVNKDTTTAHAIVSRLCEYTKYVLEGEDYRRRDLCRVEILK